MDETPDFLAHLHQHCTGGWQLLRYFAFNLWQCSRCRAVYPDCTWVREAATRETRAGVQIRQLACEGKRLLRNAGGTA